MLTVAAALTVSSTALARSLPAPAGPWIVVVERSHGGGGRARGALPRINGVPGDAAAHRQVRRIIGRLNLEPSVVYRHVLDGFAAQLSTRQLALVRADPAVSAVVPDVSMHLDSGLNGGPESGVVRTTTLDHPVVPTGIRRIHADLDPLVPLDGTDDRVDADVAIIDSGIAPHPDLRIAGGHDCTSRDQEAWRDRAGHGTHVAGIVGAIDNDLGVVGVAPGVRLWAAKVLTDTDEGSLSSYLCGLDWVMGQRQPGAPERPRMEVVNMSLGVWLPGGDDRDCGRPASDLVHQAVCALVADGTVVVVAAGNQEMNAALRAPPAYDEALTVSALADFDGRPGGVGRQADICPWYSRDRDDTYGDFSNWGPDVDMIAPGKCILSTYPGQLYAWSTGTSMATPHVAGAAAVLMAAHPGARPGQIKAALLHATSFDWNTATDPDGRPDPLLDLSALGSLPDLDISGAPPDDELAPGGAAFIDLALARSWGEVAPVEVRAIGLPDGLSVELGPARTRGDMVHATVRSDGTAAAGLTGITFMATDGDLTRSATVDVSVRGGGPVVQFSSPADGTTITDGGGATVAWTEVDPAAAPDQRRIRRQRGNPRSPGTCDGVTWTDDGAALDVSEADPVGSIDAGWSFEAADLAPDACYRWVVRLVDADGGAAARWASGAVLVDTSDPMAPLVLAQGEAASQRKPSSVIWVRAGIDGSLTLTASGRDRLSGVEAHLFSVSGGAAGWTVDPGPVAGDPGTVQLGWTQGAVDAVLAVTATDAAGHVGPARQVPLRVDDQAPVGLAWSEPRSRMFSIVGGYPELRWGGGRDAGSGIAALQLIQRDVAVAVERGSCTGVTWAPDGPARRLEKHHQEWDVQSGHCYRWVLTPLDNVGNRGQTVVSGVVLVDVAPPAGDFLTPNEGPMRIRPSTSITVRWTEHEVGGSGPVRRTLEREIGRPRHAGTCSGVTWRPSGPADTGASPARQSGLRPGFCYRWRLNLEDQRANSSVFLSGAVLIAPR